MGRYRGPVCKFCRTEGGKLFLKGERCFTDKCSFERRSYPPGEHGRVRKKFSEYSIQLREKQKARRIYGLLERQFRRNFLKAVKQRGITGTNLLVLLERRLDNVVYRLGFAYTRAEARQLIRHNHFLVNGQRVSIPSFLVRVGDVVSLREKSRKIEKIKQYLQNPAHRTLPAWLELEPENFSGLVRALPVREDITEPIEEGQIAALYSR